MYLKETPLMEYVSVSLAGFNQPSKGEEMKSLGDKEVLHITIVTNGNPSSEDFAGVNTVKHRIVKEPVYSHVDDFGERLVIGRGSLEQSVHRRGELFIVVHHAVRAVTVEETKPVMRTAKKKAVKKRPVKKARVKRAVRKKTS